VRSLSIPNELLMSIRNFFKHGQEGNWLGPANSETCSPEGKAGIQVFVEPCYPTFLLVSITHALEQ